MGTARNAQGRNDIMQIAICDDNAAERARCATFVEAMGKKRGINFAIITHENGNQLLFALDDERNKPDIVLLDVLMPHDDGIAVGKTLRAKGFDGIIIYLTRSREYAISAYDAEAFNYVLKGGDAADERFEKVFCTAVDKVQQRMSKRILVNNIREHRNIPINTITYFESDHHVITVHYGFDKTFEFISSITKLENRLISFGFIRIQRSYLVNRTAIESYNAKQVRLFDGTELSVGRARYADLCQVMESMQAVNATVGDGEVKRDVC